METLPEQPEAAHQHSHSSKVDGVSAVRQRLYLILEAGKTGDRASSIFDLLMVFLILANVLAFAAETDVALAAEYGTAFELFNIVSIAVFTVEYLLRLWVCIDHPPLRQFGPVAVRFRWALTPSMLIDLAVILPFFLSLLFAVDLRVLRVFRLLRFLKLTRFSPALDSLGRVLYAERRAIFGALIVMLGLLFFSASIIYALEHEAQPEEFGSVFRSMWWALATLTTVGYGDIVPITSLGKLFGGLVMLFGLAMFALPIAIVSSGFAREIHRRDFVVSWGMVARVPLFQGLAPAILADLVEMLEAQVVDPGVTIAHRGDVADAMYFIVVGRVQLDFQGRVLELEDGEFFGEMALLDDRMRSATITTLSRCHLLALAAPEFRKLISRHPHAHDLLQTMIRARKRSGRTDDLEHEIAEERSGNSDA